MTREERALAISAHIREQLALREPQLSRALEQLVADCPSGITEEDLLAKVGCLTGDLRG